jgi:hypothetical protein
LNSGVETLYLPVTRYVNRPCIGVIPAKVVASV